MLVRCDYKGVDDKGAIWPDSSDPHPLDSVQSYKLWSDMARHYYLTENGSVKKYVEAVEVTNSKIRTKIKKKQKSIRHKKIQNTCSI